MTPPIAVTIRRADATDADAMAPLIDELGYPAPADVLSRRLEALHDAGEVVLVAERDRELLGIISVHLTRVLHRPTPVGRISMLVVAERAHGQGIGRALVAAAERMVVDRGCALIEVTSNNRRADAHAFYRHLGYEETSVRFKKDL